jgi:hypothetical protein
VSIFIYLAIKLTMLTVDTIQRGLESDVPGWRQVLECVNLWLVDALDVDS